MPPKNAEDAIPWNRVNVDIVGPLSVKQAGKKTLVLYMLTMIDPATGWFEAKYVTNKEGTVKSEDCMAAFDDTWLTRYPRPQYLGYNNGSKFKNVFEQM